MEFDFSKRPIKEWRALLNRAPKANWLQSLPFAKATQMLDQKVTRLALIKDSGKAIGMMALQELKLGPVHILNLYRGPLWFHANPPESWFADFAVLFDRTYPKRLLRRRRWLPEWRDSSFVKRVLAQTSFRSNKQSYETVWLDLQQSLEGLKKQLKQKWRNALNKGERAQLQLKEDWSCKTANLFLIHYELDKQAKTYRGRSPSFVKAEMTAALTLGDVGILWAYKGKDPVAAILIVVSGRSASYRIGWTTNAGRKTNAHNVLLWHAIKLCKAKKMLNFDLGGIDLGAQGLTHFKRGLGGESLKLAGVFK